MPSALVDLVKINALSIGSGAILLGPAVPGYRGVEALQVNNVYSCSIQQDAQWEFGQYTLLASPYRLTRSVLGSSNGGAAINLLPGATISFTALSFDLGHAPQPFGFGPPADTAGMVGEFYYDLTNLVIYGPKTLTGWGPGFPLSGKPGATGLAANTFTTLADLAAAPTAQFKSATIVGIPNAADGPLIYETANAPYTLGPTVFQSDQPLAVGAWVRLRSLSLAAKAQGAGTVVRSQQDKNNDAVSIRDYGAIGDGTLHKVSEWIIPGARGRFTSLVTLQAEYPHVTSTDQSIDWAAIQAALNGVKAVYAPTGIYVSGEQITIGSGRTLYGDGPGCTIFKKVSETQPRLIVNADFANGNTDLVIRDLTIDGSRVSGPYAPLTDGIYLTRCSRHSVINVVVRNCLNDGLIDEYGVGIEVQGCAFYGNAKDGGYFSGGDLGKINNNTSYNNGVGGFAFAANFSSTGTGNSAWGNMLADVLAGRDSRRLKFSCHCNSDNALYVTAEPIGANNIPQTLHTASVPGGVTYPGNNVLYGCYGCELSLSGHGRVFVFLSDDNLFNLNLDGSPSQGVLLFGSSRNGIIGSVRAWGSGFGGLQFADAAAGDGVPASMNPPIASNNNDYGKLTLFDPFGNRPLVNGTIRNNLGFGARLLSSVAATDLFYAPPTDWLPNLSGDGTAGAFTYLGGAGGIGQMGRVTRVGKMVTVSFRIILTAINTAPTGNIRIALPYPVRNGVSVPLALGEVVANIGAPNTAVAAIASGDFAMLIVNSVNDSGGSVTGAANLSAGGVVANSRFGGTFTYETN